MSPRPAGKAKVVRKRTTSQRSGGSENRMIATLRSEVDELKHENEDLKRRMEVYQVRIIMYILYCTDLYPSALLCKEK